jgi:hypothetical protein
MNRLVLAPPAAAASMPWATKLSPSDQPGSRFAEARGPRFSDVPDGALPKGD